MPTVKFTTIIANPFNHAGLRDLLMIEWVSWFNNHRLMAPLGYVPPAEFEAAYYRNLEQQAIPA